MLSSSIKTSTLTAALTLACVVSAAPVVKKPWNVLLLSVDDLRPELSCTDTPGVRRPSSGMHTPNICKLANSSLVLARSQVSQSTCAPSRTAMVTGRHPGTTRVWDLYNYWRNVSGDFTTIPQLFKQRGYYSVGMGKLYHPGDASGSGGNYPCPSCKGSDDGDYSWSAPYFHGQDPFDYDMSASSYAVPKNLTDTQPLCDTQVMENALSTLSNLSTGVLGGGKPFFLSVGFHKPHMPWVFPAEFLDFYPEEDIHLPLNPYAPVGMPEVAWQMYGETMAFADIAALNLTSAINTTMPDAKTREMRRAYYASTTYADYNVGRVMAHLEEVGLADSTIVAFWGDHGYQLGEHGQWDKHTNFDIATHAPVMIKVPGLTDGGVVTRQVTEAVDIMPTLAELALGEKIPGCPRDSSNVTLCTEGLSLAPLIQQPEKPVKQAALSVYPREDYYPLPGVSYSPSGCLYQACVMGYSILTYLAGHEVRYTEWVGFGGPGNGWRPMWNVSHGTELYNHTSDAEENWNVFEDADEEVLVELKAILHNKVAR